MAENWWKFRTVVQHVVDLMSYAKAQGLKNIEIDKLARKRMEDLGITLNTKEFNELKALIRAEEKKVPPTPEQKDKLLRRSVSVPFDIGIRDSSITDVPSLPKKDAIIPKSLPETLSESDFAKLRGKLPINLQEFIDDPSAAAPSWKDQKEQLRQSRISRQPIQSDSIPREWQQAPRLGYTRREDQERAVENQYLHDPWYRKGQYPTGLDTFPDQDIRIKAAVNKALNAPFDKDKDIFHKIAYGIGEITGQDPSVGSSDPTVSPEFPERQEMMRYLKKGGKVKKKKKSKKQYTSKKKYSMNRGGMASVRKPTRA